MIKLKDILNEITLQEISNRSCIKTELLLEGKMPKLEYSNHIQILDEGLMDLLKKGKDVVIKWFKENILTKLITFIKKAAKGVKEELDLIIFGLKKLLALVTKFKEKHPLLFKIIIISFFIVVFLVISTASAQAQDPAGMGYTTNQLNSMIGMVDMAASDMEASGFDMMDIMNSKQYLHDLKDGTVDGNWGEGAKELASVIEGTFSKLTKEAEGEGPEAQSAMKIIMDAFNYGKNMAFSSFGFGV